jgi:hypothetical protein
VRALLEFRRLVHFLFPQHHKEAPIFRYRPLPSIVRKSSKNAKGLIGICGGVHGGSQGLQCPTRMATFSLICGWSVPVPEYASLVRIPQIAHPRSSPSTLPVIVVLQDVNTHERRRHLLRRLQRASGTYFTESLKDTNSLQVTIDRQHFA